MKFKWTLPYVLFGASALVSGGLSAQYPDKELLKTSNDLLTTNVDTALLAYASNMTYDIDAESEYNNLFLDAKAENLCYNYTNNVTESLSRIKGKRGTSGYYTSVRKELPGAPAGKHCLYGQYVNLDRALDNANDTLTIIPKSAKASCKMFKSEMRKKYSGKEYAGCIMEGNCFESDSLYKVAFNAFMKKQKIQKGDKFDYVTTAMDFSKKNFSADELAPGTILIVPRRRGARNQFHAIVLMGRGRVENGKFVPDNTGRHIYAGLNRENIGDLFKSYDMTFVFAANTEKIARIEYNKEFSRIEKMSNEQLVQYLKNAQYSEITLRKMTRPALLRLARDKYFNINQPIKNNQRPMLADLHFNPQYNQNQLLAMNTMQKTR
ncbi:MAG: hypothetical protein R8M37_00950 [Alphaproteobacteria bacterium]|nr:hypothetical protein [Alphaproteobacteria bacterium]